MAVTPNPRKVFNWIMEIEGVNQFEIQKVTLPEIEVESTPHGETNHDIKTGGRLIIPDLVLEKIRPAPQGDNWAWNWLRLAADSISGAGILPISYKRIVIIKEMDTTGLITLSTHLFTGAWIKKIGKNDFDRLSSDNIIETITISVDTYEQL